MRKSCVTDLEPGKIESGKRNGPALTLSGASQLFSNQHSGFMSREPHWLPGKAQPMNYNVWAVSSASLQSGRQGMMQGLQRWAAWGAGAG